MAAQTSAAASRREGIGGEKGGETRGSRRRLSRHIGRPPAGLEPGPTRPGSRAAAGPPARGLVARRRVTGRKWPANAVLDAIVQQRAATAGVIAPAQRELPGNP